MARTAAPEGPDQLRSGSAVTDFSSAASRPAGPLPAGRKRGRPPAAPRDVQVEMIVRAAVQRFSAQGYSGTTMEQVARACRISKRTVYELFPSKVSLFAAVISSHRFALFALPGDYSHLTPEEALAAIVRLDLDAESDLDRFNFMHMMMRDLPRNPDLWPLMREYGGRAAQQLLAGWIEERVARGDLVAEDPMLAAKILLDMVLGILKPHGGELEPYRDHELRKRHLGLCIRIFLQGLTRKEIE